MDNEIKLWHCKKCDQEKPVGKFRVRLGARGQVRIDNTCKSCKAKAEYSKLRLEMLEAFGWKCSCCGVDHPYFLSLEHIQGISPYFLGARYGKGAERKQTSTYVLYRLAKRENWDPAKYECLCMNCNFADGHYGACPHRSGVTKEQVIASLRAATVGIGMSHRKPLGGGDTRYKAGASRPEMVGNTHYPKTRGARGRFSKTVVDAELLKIERASE